MDDRNIQAGRSFDDAALFEADDIRNMLFPGNIDEPLCHDTVKDNSADIFSAFFERGCQIADPDLFEDAVVIADQTGAERP